MQYDHYDDDGLGDPSKPAVTIGLTCLAIILALSVILFCWGAEASETRASHCDMTEQQQEYHEAIQAYAEATDDEHPNPFTIRDAKDDMEDAYYDLRMAEWNCDNDAWRQDNE